MQAIDAVTASPLEDEVILAERIKTYLAESKAQTVAGAVVFSIIAFAARDYSPGWTLLVASLMLAIATGIRMQQIWLFSRKPDIKPHAQWGRVQTWCAGLAGMAWALAFVPMMDALPLGYRYFVIAVCAVSISTSVAEGFSYLWPSIAFSVSLLIPLISWLLLKGESTFSQLALLLMIMFPLLIWQSTQRGKALVQSILLRLNIEQLAHELVYQRDLAEKADKEKTRFLAAASHDLRQPVFASLLLVDALKMGTLTQSQQQLIGKLDQSIRVFSNQLERLLDLSRFDAGLVKTQAVAVSLTALFEWLEQMFANSAHEKGLRFMLHIPGDRTLGVLVDRGLIESALLNIVSNAMKFTRRGGILIGARVRAEHVLIQVWDTGIGIEAMHIPRIFDEFYQVDNPQRNRESGLGLGLSIVKRAMGLLGGEITCRSRPGHGSMFELKLPIADSADALPSANYALSRETVAAHSAFAGKRVVVLEDDLLVNEAIVVMLRELGAGVMHYASAELALADPDAALADFYIVDYSLGGRYTGAEYLDLLQASTGRKLRAVVLTGETAPAFLDQMAERRWPILHKPLNLASLVAYL